VVESNSASGVVGLFHGRPVVLPILLAPHAQRGFVVGQSVSEALIEPPQHGNFTGDLRARSRRWHQGVADQSPELGRLGDGGLLGTAGHCQRLKVAVVLGEERP
jgi:hypothetical protein